MNHLFRSICGWKRKVYLLGSCNGSVQPSLLHPFVSGTLQCSKNAKLQQQFSFSSSSVNDLHDVLLQVKNGTLNIEQAERLILRCNNGAVAKGTANKSKYQVQHDLLESFATIDHDRSQRTGFPEVVFSEGKTAEQVALILDDMAENINERIIIADNNTNDSNPMSYNISTAILATRVSQDLFQELSNMKFTNGSIEYYKEARIISMKANALAQQQRHHIIPTQSKSKVRVVVATAGTTDIPVSEEAAVTLEAAGITVTRIYDCGVAGLHRIIRAMPQLTHEDVGCVIVCAGMDGALPSVVGGLVRAPVIAVPTSIGYGASFGGVSALLTMLNSCSPGVAVVNIDNGFGAAAFAYKCIQSSKMT